MKKLFLISGILACGYAFQACNNSGSSQDSVDSAKSMNDSTKNMADSSRKAGDTVATVAAQPVDKASADFAVKAASGGMMEVQMGKIAQDKASSQRVKDFGAMMVQDHSKAGDVLMAKAKSQNIMLPATPGADEQKMIDKLSQKSGKDFDKAYMDMMLDDHKTDIAEFKKAADKCTNTVIKDFAAQTLPTLEKHLDSAKAITGKK
jgi:putative membrane protein